MSTDYNRRFLLTAASALAFAATTPVLAQGRQAFPPAPKPEDWAKSEATQFVTLSPDGSHIAYIAERDMVKTLYTFDLVSKKAETFNLGSAVVTRLSWYDNDHILVMTITTKEQDSTAGGNYNYDIATMYNLVNRSQFTLFADMQFFRGFVSTNPIRVVMDGKVQVVAGAYTQISNGGNGSTVGPSGDDFTYLYRFDLDGKSSSVLDQAPPETDNWVLTPDGNPIARSLYYPTTHMWMVDFRKGNSWKTVYSAKTDTRIPYLTCLANDGVSVIVHIPEGDTAGNWHQLSADGTLSEGLLADSNIQTPIQDTFTFRYAGYSEYDGWSHLHFSDKTMGGLVAKVEAAAPGYRVALTDYSEDRNKVIMYTEGDDDGGTYFFIDFKTGESLEVGASYPNIPKFWIASKTAFRFKAGDGLSIEAYISLPPDRPANDLPLIVIAGDGPETRFGSGHDWIVETFVALGYAVLQVNARGSGRYGLDFIAAGYNQWGRGMLTDLSDGVAYLVSQGTVDASRVAIYGSGSFAGYTALCAVTIQSGIYRCAVDIAGIVDMDDAVRLAKLSGPFSPTYLHFMKFVGNDTDLSAISPIDHAKNGEEPVLVIHSISGRNGSYTQSQHMVGALKSAGRSAELITLKGSPLWSFEEDKRVNVIRTVCDFLVKNNPPI